MLRVSALPLCGAVILLAGCAQHQQVHARPAIITKHLSREAGFTPQQTSLAADLCFMGMPKKTSTQLGPTEFIFRQGYVLEHSSIDKIPIWVCEHVKKDQLGTGTDRSNAFKTDPDLKGPKSTPEDYLHSGYDQGHQAPAGNQGVNQKLQDETFYMSNMAPQFPQMNRNAWKTLEALTRAWVMEFSEAYEFTGPIFYDPKEDNPTTADGVIKYFQIGADGVGVPTHFYKIVVVKDGGKFKAIAFVMPNLPKFKSPYHLEQYLQSVDWVEDHTGLTFMPDLTAQQRIDLKSKVSPMWP